MNLNGFDIKEILGAALKAEIDSEKAYLDLANRVRNALLKDRLIFLASEERKHQEFVRFLYQKSFPDYEVIIPSHTPVPLPSLKIEDETMPISKVLQSAMDAEKAAHEFYRDLAERFVDDKQTYGLLMYFSSMELGHYKILEIEKQSAEKLEDVEIILPFIHVGP